MSIEVIKEKLRGAQGKASSPELDEALALLDALPDPVEEAKRSAVLKERLRGARVRAKLAAANGIYAMMDAKRTADVPEGNTWRDGYVAGLAAAQAHVQALSDVDVDQD